MHRLCVRCFVAVGEYLLKFRSKKKHKQKQKTLAILISNHQQLQWFMHVLYKLISISVSWVGSSLQRHAQILTMCNAGSEYSSRERRAVSRRRLPRTRTPAPAHPTHDAAAEHNVYSLSTAGFGCPMCGAVTYHILDEQSWPICVKSRMTTENWRKSRAGSKRSMLQ